MSDTFYLPREVWLFDVLRLEESEFDARGSGIEDESRHGEILL
jgi:hypothetical protein